jgi:Phage tail tube protein
MAPPSGLSAQLGIVAETPSYGTNTVVTRFYEFVSESVKQDIARIESKGLRAGNRVLRTQQWVPGGKKPAGDIEMEVGNKGFGLWLLHAFGAVATSQPSAGPDPTVYEHLFTPGDITGKSLTVQIGRPDQAAVVRPFTYTGAKIEKWELSAKVDELAMLKVSLLAQEETTATGLATASYPSGYALFVFTQGTLSVGGSAIDVTEATISGDNKLADDRFKLGSALRKEPLETDLREYTGDITAYFTALTDYARFTAGTEAALVLDFVGAVISTTYTFELKVTMNVRFDGDTPNVGGPEEIMQPLKVKAVDAGSGAISVLYRSTDVLP